MKTLTLTTAAGLILLVPASALASPDEDVTIRVMEIQEDNARQQMMNLIPLPEFANEDARLQAMKQRRERVMEREHDGTIEDMAEDPGLDQARELADEMEQETINNDMQGGPRN